MDEGNYTSYIVGFILSIALTLAAFGAVMYPQALHLSMTAAIIAVLALAVIQLVVQLIFFLHLVSGKDRGSRVLVFASTLGLVLIIVLGSIWIMNHLNYNMMASPSEMMHYIQSQQGF